MIGPIYRLFLIFIFGCMVNFANAQITLTGQVLDQETGQPLIGAAVQVSGTAIGVATDLDGRFQFIYPKSGEVSITLSFLGYEKLTLPVSARNGQADLGTIFMVSSMSSLETFTVRASLEGQQRALNQQRTADNIKNVISAELMGRFPDLNVAESMQRIPGINIQRDKGEGSTVSIRGTPQHFTTIQINGEQIPSVQQNGNRNEALDLIPADQLASMEITKAPTPDIDGDAIGGVINLKTPVARSLDPSVSADLALGYNDLSGGLNGIGKLKMGKRFLANDQVPEGRMGLILGGSYYSTDNSEDRTDATWLGIPRPISELDRDTLVMGNYQYRRTQNNRERIGATLTLDYRFSEDSELIFNYMYNRRSDEDLRNRLRFDMDRSGARFISLDSIVGGRARRDIDVFDEVKTNQSFNLQGIHQAGRLKVDWGAYYTFSNRTYESQRGDFARDEIGIVIDSPNGIYSPRPAFRTAAEFPSVYDPFLFGDFRRYEEDFETTDATNLVGKVDLRYDFSLAGKFPVYLKAGGKYRTQTNDKFRQNRVLRINDPNNLVNEEESFLRSMSGSEPISFLDTDYRFGPLLGRNQFQSYIQSIRRFQTSSDDAWDALRLSLNDTYQASEDITAAYLMGRAQLDKLMVLAGVRWEDNRVRYDAFEVFRVGTNVTGDPISGGTDYSFILPNLHLKYSLGTFQALRFSAVYNYARPNFVDIVPFVNFDADAITLTLGNPDLSPAKAFNLDLMFENYFENVGIFSVGLFYKAIDKFQFSRIDPSLSEDFPGYPSTQGFRFRQEQNGENAKVGGVEVNFVRALDFLPGVLQNLNLDANYTFAASDAFTQDRTGIALPGQARHTFNTSLSFDYKGFSARVMGNYNGTFVSSLASQAQDDIFQKDRFQVDVNASYVLSDRWRIYGEWVNVNNAASIQYQGDISRLSRVAYFGWWTRIGVGFKL
ncbi:TonB-dependent receptor [Algoriphagus confluentis]|uniref:TonB-dependent receptor n=1 Tax=Algoriphagus confluentis TaxID=1697556 RepID=A0ABQ6PKR3_9BACT|nr:TonB-dependent receptor [Algoriphagus confluentis]